MTISPHQKNNQITPLFMFLTPSRSMISGIHSWYSKAFLVYCDSNIKHRCLWCKYSIRFRIMFIWLNLILFCNRGNIRKISNIFILIQRSISIFYHFAKIFILLIVYSNHCSHWLGSHQWWSFLERRDLHCPTWG